MPLAEKRSVEKGRRLLSPPQHTEPRSASALESINGAFVEACDRAKRAFKPLQHTCDSRSVQIDSEEWGNSVARRFCPHWRMNRRWHRRTFATTRMWVLPISSIIIRAAWTFLRSFLRLGRRPL